MVAETAVEEYRQCLQSFQLSEEKLIEQGVILDKILAVKAKEGATAEEKTLYNLLDTITGSLLKLTVNVTNEMKSEVQLSREKLLKCEEEM